MSGLALCGRRIVAGVLVAGAISSLAAPGLPIVLLGRDVPISWLAATGECFAAVLLFWRRASAATGVALVLWCAATALVRGALPAASCGCLGYLGQVLPMLATFAWWATLIAGTILAVRGRRCFGVSEALATFAGVACVLFGLLVVESAVAGERVLEVDGEIRKTGTLFEKGYVTVRNRSERTIRGLELEASCPCVRIPSLPQRLEPGAIVRIPLDVVGRKPGVRPRVTVQGTTGTGAVRAAFTLRLVGPEEKIQ